MHVYVKMLRNDGTFDAKSLHGSCPVIKGQKWCVANAFTSSSNYVWGHGSQSSTGISIAFSSNFILIFLIPVCRSATKWIHVGHYSMGGEAVKTYKRIKYVPPPPPDVPGCIDKHKLCEHWSESGECTDNPTFMIGNKAKPGDCIKVGRPCSTMWVWLLITVVNNKCAITL